MRRNANIFTLDLLVLSILNRGENYGYGISTAITEESDGTINIKEGVLYPILYKLLEEKLISSYDIIVNRRVRVYYRIETSGVERLKVLKNDFMHSFEVIKEIVSKGDA